MMNHTLPIDNDPRPAMDCAGPSLLGKIIQKAQWLLALDRVFQTVVPAEFASYCHVMNVNQGVLILGVSSAAVATRIRLMASQLLHTVQHHPEFRGVQGLECRVCVNVLRST